MPRPPLKRRKSNSKSPSRRVESPKNKSLRQQLDRRLANKPVGARPTDSDDSDRLVTRTPAARSQHSLLRKEIYASGAIQSGDRPGAYPTRAERRRNLQNDTAQIVRESRSRSQSSRGSTSRTASPKPNKSDASLKTGKSARKSHTSEATEAPKTVTRPSQKDVALKGQPTPLGEASILGTLKPRRRQASILQLVDNDDSSLINPEDEDRFLPDDESTPLNKSKNAIGGSGLASGRTASSRKRKFGAVVPDLMPDSIYQNTKDLFSRTSPPRVPETEQDLPPNVSGSSSAQRRRHRVETTDDVEDIMALPQSSSPESSPQKQRPDRPATVKTMAPSTEQLQSLMPTKRRRGARDRTQTSEFDIPADSDSETSDDDGSAFLPRNNTKKARPRATPTKSTKGNKTGPNKAKQAKSTDTTIPRPSDVSLRTPKPLSKSKNLENRKLRTPLQQHSPTLAYEVPSSKRHGAPTNKGSAFEKQSGGSRQNDHRSTRSSRRNATEEAALDQENINLVSPVKSTRPADDAVVTAMTKDLTENEAESPAGQVTHTSKHDEMLKWKNKWAGIDDWSLDFEEVEISTRSNSPSGMRR